jgi:hypothetical protein
MIIEVVAGGHARHVPLADILVEHFIAPENAR